MNYSEMSDAQISQRVGELVSRDGLGMIGANGKAFIHHYSAPVGEFGELCLGWKEFDPCNSWADAGPIIEKENISLTCHQSRDEWAAIFNRHAMAAHSNPLRAAMECYLIKKERENTA